MPAPIEATPAENAQVSGSTDHDRHSIESEARKRLHTTGYTCLDRIDCRFCNGVLTLSGTVTSYYQKQVAQTAVLSLEGIGQVKNEIEVRKPS